MFQLAGKVSSYHFYYTSIRSFSPGTPSWYIFLILVVLSLLLTHALSFSLFGGDWESAVSGLTTFTIQT